VASEEGLSSMKLVMMIETIIASDYKTNILECVYFIIF
jgi:hypothetical protein